MTTGPTETSQLLPDEHGSSGHGAATDHHDHHGGGRRLHEHVPMYASPKQRQRWNDEQILPHVNWGDLYFDLFYVAAAYQLSHAFKESPTGEGLLYFFASYLPMFLIWQEKLIYDARYAPDDNLFHRSMEVFHLALLGLAVSCIQPAEIMGDTYNNSTMTLFTGAYLCDNLVLSYNFYDVSRNAIGGNEARQNAKIELWRKLFGCIFYITGFVVAFGNFCSTSGSTLSSAEEGDEGEKEELINSWPARLMILGFISEFLIFGIALSFVILPRWGISHKKVMVPINIEFTIHRFGEWVMLMLGESVLSILTIPQTPSTSTVRYRISFFAGILTVTMFQYLFFRTQPSEAKDHALRRSQAGGYVYCINLLFYSASLIMVGCSYKMMLSEQEMVKEAEEEEFVYDIKQRIAFVCAISQTVSFLTLDVMLTSHRGFRVNFSRFRIKDGHGVYKWAKVPLMVMSANLVLTGLTLALSQVHDMALLSIYGCLLVFCQVILRTIGLKYFPVTIAQMQRACHPQDYICVNSSGRLEEEDVEGDHRRWPNMTEPASTGPKK